MISACLVPYNVIIQHKRRLKKAIQQARNLCQNYEDAKECRIAWDLVDDLTKAERKMEERAARKDLEEIQNWEIISHKEYEV